VGWMSIGVVVQAYGVEPGGAPLQARAQPSRPAIKSTSARAHADCWMLPTMRGGPAEAAGRRAAHGERMLVEYET
jgi:hypothetical protein